MRCMCMYDDTLTQRTTTHIDSGGRVSFASMAAHEEIDDLVDVVLQLEHNDVLLAATRSFHSIFAYFFGHNLLVSPRDP